MIYNALISVIPKDIIIYEIFPYLLPHNKWRNIIKTINILYAVKNIYFKNHSFHNIYFNLYKNL